MGSVVEVMDEESSNNIVKHEDVQMDMYLKMHDKINAKSEEISKDNLANLSKKENEDEKIPEPQV